MSSVPGVLPLRAPIRAITSLHNSLCSHRLKRLEKSNRRVDKTNIVAMDGTSEGIVDLHHVELDLESKLPYAGEGCTCGASAEDVFSDLRSAFDEVLQVHDVKVENVDDVDDSPVGANGCSDIKMTMSEKIRFSGHDKAASNVLPATSVKRLGKCATFPLTGCTSSTSADDKGNPQENAPFIRAVSLPVPRKLISALKGGREKDGLPPRKLSVSWAPDVYDPPPSSVSHLPKRNNHSYRNNKKYGKGKQKSKNSQGSRKKDKKHHRKGGEKAEPSLGLSFSMNPVVAADNEKILSNSYKSTMELLDFDNGDDNPDSNCGSSFLRRSRGTLHFPYAEAT